MGIEVGTALLLSAAIGAGSTLYASEEQKKAQQEAEEEQRRAAEEAKAEADRIAMETRPEGEQATIEFGAGGKGKKMGTFEDFLVPKTSSSSAGLSTGGGSGLGFGV